MADYLANRASESLHQAMRQPPQRHQRPFQFVIPRLGAIQTDTVLTFFRAEDSGPGAMLMYFSSFVGWVDKPSDGRIDATNAGFINPAYNAHTWHSQLCQAMRQPPQRHQRPFQFVVPRLGAV